MRKDPRKKRQILTHSSDEWVADTYTGSVCVERESLSKAEEMGYEPRHFQQRNNEN